MVRRVLGACKLCGQTAELRDSHIVPRSIIARCKGGQGQLLTFSSDVDVPPERSNYDPSEPLLCAACESFLDRKYERHGIRLLFPTRKDRGKRLVRMPDYVKFKDFQYEDTYLFFLSIFWRASVSSLSNFAAVEFGKELAQLMAACLRNGTLRLRGSAVRLDEFMKLVMVKLTDATGQLPDEWFRNTMIGVNKEAGAKGELMLYLGVGGFLVGFHVSPSGEAGHPVPRLWSSPSPGSSVFRAACVPVQAMSQVNEVLNAAILASPPTD